MADRTIVIPELDGVARLGRHVDHDPRSLDYPVTESGWAGLRTVEHQRHVPIFDQGQIGSCTGNAAAGCMGTGPWQHPTTESDALALYERATHLDRVAGVYPPTDTGSSGLAAMKAVRERGWIGSYRHAFSLLGAVTALQSTPVIIGIGWFEGFDRPDSNGVVTIAGSIRGGHEVCLRAVDVNARMFKADNSWSAAWGLHGSFLFSFDTFYELLHGSEAPGDVTVPVAV